MKVAGYIKMHAESSNSFNSGLVLWPSVKHDASRRCGLNCNGERYQEIMEALTWEQEVPLLIIIQAAMLQLETSRCFKLVITAVLPPI